MTEYRLSEFTMRCRTYNRDSNLQAEESSSTQPAQLELHQSASNGTAAFNASMPLLWLDVDDLHADAERRAE